MFGGDCGCAHTPMVGGGKKKVPKNLEDRSKEQLVARASEMCGKGVTKSKLNKMTRDELITMIRR